MWCLRSRTSSIYLLPGIFEPAHAVDVCSLLQALKVGSKFEVVIILLLQNYKYVHHLAFVLYIRLGF